MNDLSVDNTFSASFVNTSTQLQLYSLHFKNVHKSATLSDIIECYYMRFMSTTDFSTVKLQRIVLETPSTLKLIRGKTIKQRKAQTLRMSLRER